MVDINIDSEDLENELYGFLVGVLKINEVDEAQIKSFVIELTNKY